MTEDDTTPLKRVTKDVLRKLPNVRWAFVENEWLTVILDDVQWFLLSNRPFFGIDGEFRNKISRSLERRLKSGKETVVCDLGGGYLSKAALGLLGAYDDPNLTVHNVDLFAVEYSDKDPRLNIVRGDFRTVPLEDGMFDLLYSYQLIDYLGCTDGEKLEVYRRIVSLLNRGGEALINDMGLIDKLRSNKYERDKFTDQTGIDTLRLCTVKQPSRRSFPSFVYIAKNS